MELSDRSSRIKLRVRRGRMGGGGRAGFSMKRLGGAKCASALGAIAQIEFSKLFFQVYLCNNPLRYDTTKISRRHRSDRCSWRWDGAVVRDVGFTRAATA
ncbi:unnamed protein product [Leptosia nina]|uniref:Uncharacterized protein n=2 Tax=Leptosia nina TaxID=320188 RepID=A0AAV1JG31_9NEOP